MKTLADLTFSISVTPINIWLTPFTVFIIFIIKKSGCKIPEFQFKLINEL